MPCKTIHEEPLERIHGRWTQYYDNIYDAIVNGAEPIVSHRQMRRCIALIEAIFASAETEQVIRFEDQYYKS